MRLSTSFTIPAAMGSAFAIYLAFGNLDTFLFFGLPILAGVAGAIILGRMDARRGPSDQLTDALRIYFALHLIYSSFRYWVEKTQPPIPDPIGGPFMVSLNAMGIYPAVKALEGIVGFFLLVNRFVPLVLVLEVPISLNIFYLNTFITGAPRQLITGPAELGINAALLFCYFRYYRPFLRARAYAAPPEILGPSALDAAEIISGDKALAQ